MNRKTGRLALESAGPAAGNGSSGRFVVAACRSGRALPESAHHAQDPGRGPRRRPALAAALPSCRRSSSSPAPPSARCGSPPSSSWSPACSRPPRLGGRGPCGRRRAAAGRGPARPRARPRAHRAGSGVDCGTLAPLRVVRRVMEMSAVLAAPSSRGGSAGSRRRPAARAPDRAGRAVSVAFFLAASSSRSRSARRSPSRSSGPWRSGCPASSPFSRCSSGARQRGAGGGRLPRRMARMGRDRLRPGRRARRPGARLRARARGERLHGPAGARRRRDDRGRPRRGAHRATDRQPRDPDRAPRRSGRPDAPLRGLRGRMTCVRGGTFGPVARGARTSTFGTCAPAQECYGR